MSMFRSTSNFDKLLDKATSNLRLEPDWPAILQICDLIRQGDVQPKYALAAVKKKLYNVNPHIAMFGLLVLESCVKNCGNLIHDEIATKQYMEQMRDLVRSTSHENVKNKVLELIQAWAYAFRNIPKYRAVQDTVNIMKTEGCKFPALKESDAMFSADTAPEWADGDVCHRCRVQFGMMQRKHHCRACGQVFCGQCSSKTSTIPKFGIEKEVRVCEACYESLNKSPSNAAKPEAELPAEYVSSSLAQQSQNPPRKSEEELREEEELQLALALSKSEAEHKEKEKKRTTSALLSGTGTVNSSSKQYSPPPTATSTGESRGSSPTEEDVDPELARYLNRSYWEQRQNEEPPEKDRVISPSQQPSAPMSAVSVNNKQQQQQQHHHRHENGETDTEMEEFVATLKTQVEIFVNRMKSNSSRGRSIANDSSVQTLFMNITAMHSRLLKHIQQQDDSRVYYEGLQDKLAQVKDARAALDALREEHREKLRIQAEEAERIRQMQMAQKLEIMRKKKQDYLQYQRQLALRRIQEQEREMQMRQEQQKQQYLMGSYTMQPPPSYMPGYGPPPASTDASPVHASQFSGPPSVASTGPASFRDYPGMYPMPGLPNQGPVPRGPIPQMPPPGVMHSMSHGPMSMGPMSVMQGQGPPIPMGGPQGPVPQGSSQQGPAAPPQGLPQGPQMQPGLQGPQMQQGPPVQGPPPGPQMQQGPPPQGPQMQQGPPPQGPQMQQGPPPQGPPPQGPQMPPPTNGQPPQGNTPGSPQQTAELITFD